MTLDVVAPVVSNTPPFRMRYVRTDAATPYFGWPNLSWIIYNPPTSRLFVTDPYTNRIYVLDPTTESVVGTIMVPGAYGIDDTADHSTLYVGTQIGDVYAIDPVGMTVTKRYLASQIGPGGFASYSVRVMSDGRLALLGGQGGYASIDGYRQFALWNPADNSISTYWPDQCTPSMSSILAFNRTPDRTAVVMGAGGGAFCKLDASTGKTDITYVPGLSFTSDFAMSPDGEWVVFAQGYQGSGQAIVFNLQTLAQVAQFSVAGDTSSAADLFISPDSKTLYVSSSSIVYAYDLSTGQQTGWLPNIVVEPYTGGSAVGPSYGPQIQAMDTTGLLVGPMEEGVGFLDTTTLRTGAVGTQFLNGYLNPATGPTSGGTQTNWTDYFAGTATLESLPDVYFGSQTASAVSVSSGTITVTTPFGAPGRADVYALTPPSDGGVQLLPEAYSYGPTVLEITPNAATAEGGLGAIFGYGFGPTSATTFPSNLKMTVGGHAANITTFNGNTYGISAPPFPLEGFTYTIPAGKAGSTASVTVSSSSGSVTIPQGIIYLPAIQQYPLRNSALAQGIYDPFQDVYYFTDAANIQIFSRSSGAWLSPINIPSSDDPQRLWGIALSPDGSKLAFADSQGMALYVLNPDNPAVVTKYPIPEPQPGAPILPIGVAISDAGVIYFTAANPEISGATAFFKFDTNTQQVKNYNIVGPGLTTDNYLRTAISSDNSTVYFNSDGQVFSIDTATDAVTYATQDQTCCYGDYDLSLSSNQSVLAATGYFYDSSLNAESYNALNLREMMAVSYVYGEKLSPDGRLLFQPTVNGIDVLDARLGNLLERIALPITLSPNYDALVSDGTDNILVAITGASGDGIAVIDLTSIPDPSPLPYIADLLRVKHPPATEAAASNNHSATQVQAGGRSSRTPARPTVPHVTVSILRPR